VATPRRNAAPRSEPSVPASVGCNAAGRFKMADDFLLDRLNSFNAKARRHPPRQPRPGRTWLAAAARRQRGVAVRQRDA
jgi:hypothetical protein